ncbi:response regulator transcription factor [Desulfosporosinus sp. BICA1-9]|uniref:response regulator transcription factor n=1 Tax=Desulfosporosinus sp. BICA1-9 TaxID=1531958 RepID=UPI00054BC244|nr:response regulator transcription factor [Desulfosporosinus sp. BICA1-9]KJS50134.1 MAG: transcriptional regulator [Peptococcaceae bacterium BRH_c23]KJS84502.1 MAG: transcriptional regulator [Desulfosporosinus sp. BICA1-9]HBW35017.1 DNA-binding response regulator [Desulfosporosinus sp.]
MAYCGKVLIVDDDQNVLELVTLYGEREGFKVIGVSNGDLVLAAFDRENPDVVILDIMLPGQDGLTLCRNLRAVRMVPIIMLTAKGEEADRVLGLEMGADDYVSKPFSPRELVARIKALLRRTQPVDAATNWKLKYPGLEIFADSRTVLIDSQEIEVTPREYDLLYYLAQNPRRVFSREELLAAVWGYDFFGDERTIDVHIRRLRTKLAPLPFEYLTTVWGVGYQFTPPAKGGETTP